MNDSEEWRFECEVRFVANLPLKKRREYLVKVMDVRGMASRKQLEAALMQMWKEKK